MAEERTEDCFDAGLGRVYPSSALNLADQRTRSSGWSSDLGHATSDHRLSHRLLVRQKPRHRLAEGQDARDRFNACMVYAGSDRIVAGEPAEERSFRACSPFGSSPHERK